MTWTYRNGEEAQHFAILESLGGGVGVLDVDSDGHPDAVIPGGGEFLTGEALTRGLPTGLFRNLGDLQFVDASGTSKASESKYYSHGVACCDVDNDGFSDFLITGYGGLQLWMNRGDGTFEEVAGQAQLADSQWSSSAAFGDFNGDGNPDLYVAHYVNWSFENHPACPGPEAGLRDVCPPRDFEALRDTFYLSRGDGTFEDATDAWGLRQDGKGLGVVVGDVDLDGDLDVYVGNDTVPNFLYRNQGDRFEDAGLMSGTSVSDRGTADGSMGVDLGDFNLDGLPDLWVANYESEGFAMYRNEGNCFFQPVSSPLGINAAVGLYVGWGTAFIDAELDGDLDVFVSNGHVIRYPNAAPLRQLPLVFQSRNGERFVNVAEQAGEYTSTPHMGRGLAVADLDHDGDQDIIVNHTNEPVAVLENRSEPSGNWIGVKLIGTSSARDAHGAVLHIRRPESRDIVLQIKSGSSYASTSDRTLIAGLGNADDVASISIRWPSRAEQVLVTPVINTVTTVVEQGRLQATVEVAE
ncbi:MAG: CRTAC1 family protein [Planctomycetota bacterium]